ncbi:unnamed protein product [Aureobasidium pullulans]|uniref:DUF155-domain-containing protein n=1 Tax=Aureobasidium pullulans TaxID=5580 RepID=A0A4T0D2B8_AURPU|nr:DUF155-domain-containing protein [Aureobasidium pullulans]TIA54980.1 DUF155-domain-containing protein [Aureobasidium pullulans]TIA85880.1 DUF155-domain-containing protein [Aureobasidium pullulans]CAC9887495.1 unnamed protein product [Aureobasidium pullulans]
MATPATSNALNAASRLVRSHSRILSCRLSCPPRPPAALLNPRLKHSDTTSPPHDRKPIKRLSPRSQNTTTSLRRVALEAQRSRDSLIRRSGKHRFVDPDIHTNQVTAYCAAEQYDIPTATRVLKQEGYCLDPWNTALYPQVIHFQTPDYSTTDASGQDSSDAPGDVFVFPSGTLVCWNVPEHVQLNLLHRLLLPAAESPHLDRIEIEDLEYIQDSSHHTSEIIGDTIILGTKPSSTESSTEAATPLPSSDVDTVLAKIAFSSGLARSTKLAVLEDLLSSYFSSTRSIPTILSRGSPLRFSRSFILRKTGELLSIRAQLNLYSELTDSLPDIFWDSPSSLGLSAYYDEVGRALDVGVRIKVLNERMDYAGEIASVLRERLSEKHSTGLEWLIIFLISIEVGFELWRIWRERQERLDPASTEALLRRLLLRDMHQHDSVTCPR